jgi:uncharacterized membrane protein (Fun14 family)
MNYYVLAPLTGLVTCVFHGGKIIVGSLSLLTLLAHCCLDVLVALIGALVISLLLLSHHYVITLHAILSAMHELLVAQGDGSHSSIAMVFAQHTNWSNSFLPILFDGLPSQEVSCCELVVLLSSPISIDG